MAYTYGANIQSNPNAAYNLWGSTGPSNPYITQGPGYTPGSYPTNQQQQASLLPMTNNVPRPGFNDTDGTPINTFQTAQQAVDGGDKHYAYVKDHADWRYHTGDYADDGILAGQGKQIGQSDFDYPGRAFTNSTGGNVQVGEASWDSAKELGGKFVNAVMPGGFVRSLFNANTNIPNLIKSSAANLFDYNYHPLSESFTKQNEPGFDASDQSTFIKPTSNSLMDEPSATYSPAPVTSAAPTNLNTVVSDDGDAEEAWYANNGYY